MKFSLMLFVLLATSTSFASEIVKSCKITLQIPGDPRAIPTLIEITKQGTELIATTTQTVEGKVQVLPQEAVILTENSVRAGVSQESADLNLGEALIVSTQEFLKEPEIGSKFSVGLDLTLIRWVRIYQVGEAGNMGGTFIVEARDGDAKELGSFVTGFMPFACQ